MAASQAVLCRYRYDPLDRLASSSPAGQADVQRFYQKNRLATEIQGTVQRTVFQHEDLLLAQQRRTEAQLDTTLWATDQQRSVLQLVDKTGTEPMAYSVYGHHPAESGLTSVLGFNGERCDPVTGHYLLGNGYRAYNPVLMRFNSPDNLSPFDEGGLNAYGYCGWDPVGFVDPTGHWPFFTPYFKRTGPWTKRDILTDYIIPNVASRNQALVDAQSAEWQTRRTAQVAQVVPLSLVREMPRSISPVASSSTPAGRVVPEIEIFSVGSEDRHKISDRLQHAISIKLPKRPGSARRKLGIHKKRVAEVAAMVDYYANKRNVVSRGVSAETSEARYNGFLIRDTRNLEAYEKAFKDKYAENLGNVS